MSYYGDYEKDNLKDNLKDTIDEFLENYDISDLMDIVKDSIYAKECDMFNKYKKQILKKSMDNTKKQVEEMKKIIK